jgi:hypothetical protein
MSTELKLEIIDFIKTWKEYSFGKILLTPKGLFIARTELNRITQLLYQARNGRNPTEEEFELSKLESRKAFSREWWIKVGDEELKGSLIESAEFATWMLRFNFIEIELHPNIESKGQDVFEIWGPSIYPDCVGDIKKDGRIIGVRLHAIERFAERRDNDGKLTNQHGLEIAKILRKIEKDLANAQMVRRKNSMQRYFDYGKPAEYYFSSGEPATSRAE